MRLFVFDGIKIKLPQFQICQKFRARVGEFFVRREILRLFVHWPVARILHCQRGGDDQHIGQTAARFPRQQHAGNGGIHREFGEFQAEW